MSFTGDSLVGTKWRFNTSISVSDSVSYIFDFYSYYAITGEKDLYGYFSANDNPEIQYDGISVYYSNWVNDSYREIEIIGGDDVETASLITFLESNAEFLGYANVTVEYDGNVISGMFGSGAKAIRTLGKFCTSDFIIRYTAPEGGGSNLNISFYTPT